MKTIFHAALLLTFAALLVSTASAQQSNLGSIFTVVKTPNENFDNNLQAASASSDTDIWAVGQETIHYNGTTWTAYPAPEIAGDNTSFLGGVVDISPTLAWAAGTINIGEANPGQVIEQWNGTEWSEYPGPTFASGDQPAIFGMTSTSADDIWAVGDLLADDGGAIFALFEHWDGTEWTAMTASAGTPFLMNASADAVDDAWAVGYNAEIIDEDLTLAMHWNGTTWSQVSTPNVGAGNNILYGVAALASDNVWAVGYSTPVAPPQSAATLTLIEHYNGTSWEVVSSPNVGPVNTYESNRLFGIVANTPSDIWAFGSYFAPTGSGHQQTLLLHYNGTKWTIQPSPNPTKGDFLSDILWAGVVPSPGNIYIFGAEDEAPNEDSLAIHTTTGK